MATISNSSPLILFAKISRLELLRLVFAELIVPTSVYEEVVIAGAGRAGAAEVATATWIRSQAVANQLAFDTLLETLDPGEAEAIALAAEMGEQVTVVLDDRKARHLARQHGLIVVGSAGVLLLAKVQGIIPQVRPILDELRAAGLRLSDRAYSRAIADAGEASVGESS